VNGNNAIEVWGTTSPENLKREAQELAWGNVAIVSNYPSLRDQLKPGEHLIILINTGGADCAFLEETIRDHLRHLTLVRDRGWTIIGYFAIKKMSRLLNNVSTIADITG